VRVFLSRTVELKASEFAKAEAIWIERAMLPRPDHGRAQSQGS